MRSIQCTLMAWVMGALSLGAVVIVLTTYLVTLDEMGEVYDAELKNVAQALGAHHLAGLNPAHPEPAAQRRLPPGGGRTDLAEIVTATWTAEGHLVFSSDPGVPLPFSPVESLQQLRLGGEDWLVYTDVSRGGVTQAAQRLSARRAIAAESASKILLPTVALVLFVAGLLLVALRRGLRPLDDTTRDIAVRSARALAPISTEAVPREITPLVAAINGLMARLSRALALQQRFVADAAHELRSPITALRLQLQLLQRAPDAAQREVAMAELQAGVERAQRLVAQLLQVARAEPGADTVRHSPQDLGALARQVVASYSAKADHLGLDLGADAADGVLVMGDAGQLAVLLNNLVENALRYTPAGGVVDVLVRRTPGGAELRVVDNGPGIAEAERAQVFERFHRGSQAQAHAREAGGSGLGLAIVQAIARLHGAEVRLHTAPSGRGLAVVVGFVDGPACAAADGAEVAAEVAPDFAPDLAADRGAV